MRIAFLLLLFAPGALSADVDRCRWLPLAAAERAAERVRSADSILSFDSLRPAPIREVSVRELGGGTAELVIDGVPVDLLGRFVRAPGADWVHLAAAAGCEGETMPPRIAGEPFAALPDTDLARLTAPPAPAWIALAELPSVLPQWDEHPEAPVEVRAAPRDDAEPIAVLVRGGELPTDEWGYEQTGAFVLEERGDWVRLRLADGSGWVRRSDAAPIHFLADLVVDGLAYLTAAWDGLLYAAPGDARGVLAIDPDWRQRLFRPDEVSIDAFESRSIDGARWIRVRVVSRHCVDGEPAHVWAEGWIPLSGHVGEPAVGFYSRGC